MMHRRLAAIGAILAVLAAAGCRRQPTAPTRNSAAPDLAEPGLAAPIAAPEPRLDRERLIFVTMRALSAAALGQDDAARQKELKGRGFEVRSRFGCPGLPTNASRNWSYDGQKHVLRARISADLAAESVPASDLLFKGYEGVAGFTLNRPLLLFNGCPAPQFGAMNASQPVIAIAQMFTSDDSRVQRPERSYEITKAIAESGKPSEGLDLVISGRLTGLPDGRIIHCAAADGPPVCIVAAKFDRIAIENPADGSVLGEWSQW